MQDKQIVQSITDYCLHFVDESTCSNLFVSLCAVYFPCVFIICMRGSFVLMVFAHKFFSVGFSVCLQALFMCAYQSVHKLCICLCRWVFTWVNVKLAFHRLGNALQFDSLQGAVSVDGSGQAAQCLPDEDGHLLHCEDLQQLDINCWKGPQEHRLGSTRQCSIIWRLNRTGAMI